MPDLEMRALILVLAIVLDWIMGDPKRIYNHIFHPVQFMGEVLNWFEQVFNRPYVTFRMQKVRGVVALSLYLIVWGLVGAALSIICDVFFGWGLLFEILIVGVLLSGRSLYEHVSDVCDALKFKTVEEARIAVGQIVGRDASALDEYGIARAAIESGAENLSDGFVAPVMFYLIGGLPGLFLYKAVNTADSMIGYKNQRFIGFGWAAARLDDLLNYIPSRLTGFLTVLIAYIQSGRGRESWHVMLKDAGKHSSTNSGWPEAAMAGALGLALGGPRVYQDMMKQDPWINARGRLNASADDIWLSLQFIQFMVFLVIPIIGVVGLIALF